MVILSVVAEGRAQADVAREFGVSPATVSRWVARYRTDGDAAFEPRSRRPRRSPTRLADDLITMIVNLRDQLASQGLDAGPESIRWHVQQQHERPPSVSTIRRHLVAAGRMTPQPRKRPKSSFIRFQADLPNELWQTDMTHVRLADSTDREVLSWLDDHSRLAVRVTVHTRVNSPIVVAQFDTAVDSYGAPAAVLSDNGLYFTARFSQGGQPGLNRFEKHLRSLGVNQILSSPAHPTTCGKVERFQQTMKKWLAARPAAANDTELQALLDEFTEIYNHQRPHRAVGTTPAIKYQLLPKAQPGNATPELRVRHDRVDTTGVVTLRHNGRLHHIGIGRPHAGTPIVMLINDRHIRIIATTTGHKLRELHLDPTRDYQPQNPQDPNH